MPSKEIDRSRRHMARRAHHFVYSSKASVPSHHGCISGSLQNGRWTGCLGNSNMLQAVFLLCPPRESFSVRSGMSIKDGCRRFESFADRARKQGIIPKEPHGEGRASDSVEGLILMRNWLSHGTSEVHSPGMALVILGACARWINQIQPRD